MAKPKPRLDAATLRFCADELAKRAKWSHKQADIMAGLPSESYFGNQGELLDGFVKRFRARATRAEGDRRGK